MIINSSSPALTQKPISTANTPSKNSLWAHPMNLLCGRNFRHENLSARFITPYSSTEGGGGKTHLLQAIGNEVLKLYKGKKVKYVSSEKFTNELVNAIQNKIWSALKRTIGKMTSLSLMTFSFLLEKRKRRKSFFIRSTHFMKK